MKRCKTLLMIGACLHTPILVAKDTKEQVSAACQQDLGIEAPADAAATIGHSGSLAVTLRNNGRRPCRVSMQACFVGTPKNWALVPSAGADGRRAEPAVTVSDDCRASHLSEFELPPSTPCVVSLHYKVQAMALPGDSPYTVKFFSSAVPGEAGVKDPGAAAQSAPLTVHLTLPERGQPSKRVNVDFDLADFGGCVGPQCEVPCPALRPRP